MDYSQQMLARAEYNLMMNAVPVVNDNGSNSKLTRPARWMRTALLSVLHLVIR